MDGILSIISLAVAVLSFAVSALTIWLTILKNGELKMTYPNMVAIAFEPSPYGLTPKIVIRTLLYSTSNRRKLVESMILKIDTGEKTGIFSMWAYGENQIVLGSGLSVPHEGIAYYHRFLLINPQDEFLFSAGDYRGTVYASYTDTKSAKRLLQFRFTIEENFALALSQQDTGVMFIWNPLKQEYVGTLDKRPTF